jgi:hypothetical protein
MKEKMEKFINDNNNQKIFLEFYPEIEKKIIDHLKERLKFENNLWYTSEDI